ncbi:ATP-binding protein [Haloimpatiens sp. FM7315]|uniref:ATP-binding protein n=1 Tax=Haloimpatiens sp. FM7315 TaxID=3298609 RepID=UPI0035A2AEED
MSNIRIFTGHFGSGKTEIALNKAMDLAKENKKVSIVDLDIVNPYFCVRELKSKLENKGINLIASKAEYVNAELMVVPSEVVSIFNKEVEDAIIDVGGDAEGAVVLGQYNRYFNEHGYKMYFVINNKRPLTKEVEDTLDYIKAIEKSSRLKVSELISNTNMSYETTIEDILEGHRQTKELSKRLNIPYNNLVCRKDLVKEVLSKVDVNVYGIDIYMKPPWR